MSLVIDLISVQWGWASVKKADDHAVHALTWSIHYVMEAERFDDDAPPNVIYELTHSTEVKVDGVTYTVRPKHIQEFVRTLLVET